MEFHKVHAESIPALDALRAVAFAWMDPQIRAQFAGEQTTYYAEENGTAAGMIMTTPVAICGKKGVYLFGLVTAEEWKNKGVEEQLLQLAEQEARAAGAEFTCVVPSAAEQFSWYEKQGFARAFGVRTLTREIKRNIWSQAEFDAVPARALLELRARFCPQVVQMNMKMITWQLTDMYSRGATIVSAEDGYGIYYRKDETLYFVELMADGDRAAERLMEAARTREIVSENAVITVGASQNLFLGEGRRTDHGMIHFFGPAFDVSESQLRLVLDA